MAQATILYLSMPAVRAPLLRVLEKAQAVIQNDQPTPSDVVIDWCAGGQTWRLDIHLIQARMVAITQDIRSAVEEHETVRAEWEHIRRADAAIYALRTDAPWIYRAAPVLRVFEKDLREAGIDPSRFPIVIEILPTEDVPDEDLIRQSVSWPLCDYVTGHERALDRALELLAATRA